MANIKDFLELQAGKETTWGTPVNPTAKLMGITDVVIKPIIESELVEEMRGTLAPGYSANVLRVAGEASVDGVVTYEDVPYYLDGLCGTATPTGANPYTYAYTAPLGTAPTVRQFTLAYGDGSSDYSLTSGIVKSFSVSGEKNGTVEFSAEFIGEQVEADTLATLSDRSVGVVMGNDITLYIDAAAGTIGTTQITATGFAFELEVETNRELVHYLGSVLPATYREGKWEGTLKLTLEFNATSKAYLDAMLGGSSVFQKLVRIKATSGTKVVQFDFAGFAESAPELWTDEDGVITLEVELKGKVDSGTFANWFKASVTNAVASLV